MFEELTKNLAELRKAMEAVNGTIGKIEIKNVNDPIEVQRGIAEMERAIDEKLSRFSQNPSVREIAKAMKDSYRQQMLEAVAKKKREGEKQTEPTDP